MERKSTPFKTGSFVIPLPCQVPETEIADTADGNEFCSSCKKVVHNLTGKSDREINQIFEANGGRLCASFSAEHEWLVPKVDSPAKFRILPLFIKYGMAAATISLLLLQPKALGSKGLAEKPRTEILDFSGGGEETVFKNTLLPGILIDQDSLNIPHDLPVEIYMGNNLLVKTTAKAGLFHVDLGNEIDPKAVLRIETKAIEVEYHPGSQFRLYKYDKAEHTATLEKGQNLVITVKVQKPAFPKNRGMMVRPDQDGVDW